MAFVRWRGACAQVLATVYDRGRSRQELLSNVHSGYHVPETLRADVAARFPAVTVDWNRVEVALAQGPPGTPPLTPQAWDWLEVEQALRAWAQEDPGLLPADAATLRAAAQVLTNRRAQQQQAALTVPG